MQDRSANSGKEDRRSSGPSLNKVMVIGTLTRDPELKMTPKGTPLASIGLAMNRYFTNEQGERCDEVTFVDVELWGRQAELAAEYLRKGRPVYLEGRLRLDSWDDKETGQKRSKLKVVGETLQFLGNKEATLAQPPRGSGRSAAYGEEEEPL